MKRFGRPGARALALLAALGVGPALPAADSSSVTAHFSGEESLETAAARAKGKAVRIELSSAAGKRLAKADAPSPGYHPQLLLRAGSVGSAGALLEVAASEGATICRSVWRYHDGALTRLPVLQDGKPLPDCEPAGQWLTRWEEAKDAPALYERERTRDTPQGSLHETQAFAFAGFELASDAKRSGAQINGVAIPEWYEAQLYVKAELDLLFQRFGFSSLRKAPRLRFEAARGKGIFAVLLEDREGQLRLPVTASKPLEGGEPGVELTAGDPPARISVSLARGSIPQDAVVHGAGARFDGAYAPVIHWSPKEIRVYPTAEQELASEALPGVWATDRNERIAITAIPGHGAIQFGDVEVDLSLAEAPEGADLLLLPRDGTPPTSALALRGPNSLLRMPVRCVEGATAAPPSCRIEGGSQAFKRLGSQLNIR
jgi:hypothetical protein